MNANLAYFDQTMSSVFNSGRIFAYFDQEMCNDRSFGLFVLRKCSVSISGHNFGLIRKCLVFHIVDAFWLISLGNMY